MDGYRAKDTGPPFSDKSSLENLYIPEENYPLLLSVPTLSFTYFLHMLLTAHEEFSLRHYQQSPPPHDKHKKESRTLNKSPA